MTGPAKQLKGRAARLSRLLPSGSRSAARTPFVLLVVLLLGGGLIALLLLNSSLNEGSFRLSEYKRQTTDLTDEQQALQRDVADYSAPRALERRARQLGMVPGGSPAFLEPDGSVRGVPGTAEALPPVRLPGGGGNPVQAPALAHLPVLPSAPDPVPPAPPLPGVPDSPAGSPVSATAFSPGGAGSQVPAPPSAQPSGNPAPTSSGR